MNLSLERVKDLSILVVQGSVSGANFAVLRAGIRKLFKDGKNRIILEIPEASQFPSDLLRELAMLNALASELSGQIVLSGIEPLVRMRIDAFAKPPLIRCFVTREEAIAYFHPPVTERPIEALLTEKTVPAPPPKAAAPASAEGAVSLEKENRNLRHQLATLIMKRRESPDLASAQQRIATLQQQIEELIEQMATMAAAKKG